MALTPADLPAAADSEKETQEARTPMGRPRNADLDHKILGAVRVLLTERGYEAMSVQEVMRQSGVHVRTITRRWPTKSELVAAAIFATDEAVPEQEEAPVPTGQLRDDLEALVRATLSYLNDPAVRAALPALWSETHSNRAIRDQMEARRDVLTEAIRILLQKAVATGSAPAHAEGWAEVLSTILSGTAMSLQAGSTTAALAMIDDIVSYLIAGLGGARRPSAGTTP